MYPVSSAVAQLYAAEQRQVLRITGTDKNGAAISITDADIMLNGFSIDRYSCTGKRLQVGTAVSSEMSLKLNNSDGKYNSIVFENAELYAEIGIADWSLANPTISWMPCGYFTPDEQPRTRDFITLSALDRMIRFDITPFDVADLTFPTTVAALVAQVTGICNVPFTQNISSLPNANFTIQAIPATSQEITYRNIIQWCAGLMATNAFIDWNGELQFKWYTFPSSVYASTPALRYSSDHDEDNITITGITYKDSEDVVHVAGTNTYPIDMSDNLLVAANIDTAIQAVSLRLRNFTYRPFEAQTINAPFLWPMDMIRFTPTGSTTGINTIVTNVNFGINGKMALAAKGETTKAASYQSPSGFTSAQQQQIERLQQLSHEAIETAVDNATDQITGAIGNSHVKFIYDGNNALQEIVVSDTVDITSPTAKVWRWNSGGLGFSSTGYAGPYTLAMTQDGSIVATLINTGILNANLIKAGIISDTQNKNSWNLITGAITMRDGSINIGSGAFTVDTNGDMHAGNAELAGSIKSTNNDGRVVHIHSGGIDGGNSANQNIGSIVFDDLTSLLDIQTATEEGALISGDVIWLNAHDKIRVGASKDMYGFTGTIPAIYRIDSSGRYYGNNLTFYNGILINGPYET